MKIRVQSILIPLDPGGSGEADLPVLDNHYYGSVVEVRRLSGYAVEVLLWVEVDEGSAVALPEVESA